MSDSDSDSDSGDSDKEIVVRHAIARDPSLAASISRVAEPKVKSAVGEVAHGQDRDDKIQESKQRLPAANFDTKTTEKMNKEMPKAPSLARTASVDSNSSEVSVREEDIHILMRSIPEYKQYDDENGRSNDSYLRSALRSMPEDLLDCKDDYGNTLLLIASQYSCADLVKLLLRRGADPHIVNTSGACCLHFACYKDSLSMPIVELLLQQNVSVNVAETLYGCTPLHYAASTGEVELCRLLIQHGAYIHAHDFDSCSSIDYAVDAGMMELADYLKAELRHTDTHHGSNKSTIHTSSAAVLSPMRSKDDSPGSDRYGTAASHNVLTINAQTPTKHSMETPAKSAQRMIINTNNSSLDEDDNTDKGISVFTPTTNTIKEGPGSTSSYRTGHTRPPLPTPTTQFNISSSSSSSAKGSPSAITNNANNTTNIHSSSPNNTNVTTSNKSSPDHSVHSVHSMHSTYSAGSAHSSSFQADPSTPVVPSTTSASASNKRAHHQPISPSPYKPLPPSPSSTTHYSTFLTHGNSSGSGSGSDKGIVTKASPSVGGKGFFLTDDEALTNNASHYTTHHTTTTTSSTNSTIPPPLPAPSGMHLVEDSNYSNVDNITDLSPEKFELYIEQAKFNAKLAKERELHKSVLQQRDGKIISMQSEINSMRRTITSYKEEIHALSAKLDMLQLPFIEATNTLQDELQALKRENSRLREQLRCSGGSGNGGSNGSGTGGDSGIYSGKR